MSAAEESKALIRNPDQQSDASASFRWEANKKWNGMLLAISIVNCLLSLIVFGVGLHIGSQGYGGSAAAYFVGVTGLLSGILALICFYAARVMSTKLSDGIPFMSIYFNMSIKFVVIFFVLAVAMLSLRNLSREYVELYWPGDMEVVFANMSLKQAQTYVRLSMTVVAILVILIVILTSISLWAAQQTIQSTAAIQEYFLWIQLSVAGCGATIFGVALYQYYRPPAVQVLNHDNLVHMMALGICILVFAVFYLLRTAQTSFSAMCPQSCASCLNAVPPTLFLQVITLCLGIAFCCFFASDCVSTGWNTSIDSSAASHIQNYALPPLPNSAYSLSSSSNSPSNIVQLAQTQLHKKMASYSMSLVFFVSIAFLVISLFNAIMFRNVAKPKAT